MVKRHMEDLLKISIKDEILKVLLCMLHHPTPHLSGLVDFTIFHSLKGADFFIFNFLDKTLEF